MILTRNQTKPHSQPGPTGTGPLGPPRKRVTMMAAMVMALRNSAR